MARVAHPGFFPPFLRCYSSVVGTFKALARFLSVVAMCALLGAPFARDAAAVVGPQALVTATVQVNVASDMGEMPCCPGMTSERDCSKTCVLMAVCATPLMHMAATAIRAASHVLFSRGHPPSMHPLAGREDLPAPRPPNSHV